MWRVTVPRRRSDEAGSIRTTRTRSRERAFGHPPHGLPAPSLLRSPDRRRSRGSPPARRAPWRSPRRGAARRSPRRTVNAASPPANSVRKPSREKTRTMVPNGASPPEAAPMFQEIKPTPTQSASRKPTTPSAMRVPDLWEAPSPGVRPETSTTIAPTRAARKPPAAARRPTPRDSSAPRAAGSSLSAEPTRRANSKSATASRTRASTPRPAPMSRRRPTGGFVADAGVRSTRGRRERP